MLSLRRGAFLSARADIQSAAAAPDRFLDGNPPVRGGNEFAVTRTMPLDVAIGRALACCVHPWASWRLLPASGRVLLVAAYVSASYVTVLTALLAVGS
jgi:hypothetical protein